MSRTLWQLVVLLLSISILSAVEASTAGPALSAPKPGRVMCVALVDVTTPSGTPVPVASYRQQLQLFFQRCYADHALMQIYPLLDSEGAINSNFPVANSNGLVNPTKCNGLISHNSSRAQDCLSSVGIADGAITSFIHKLTPANVDATNGTTEILTTMVSATGVLSNSGALKTHLLMLSPGFQTAGNDINFNQNGGITTASAPGLVSQAMADGLVPSLAGVDVHLAGIAMLNRPIDSSYLEGTKAFWMAYLRVAGVANPSAALSAVYTAASYQH